jgi:hypothetical protein
MKTKPGRACTGSARGGGGSAWTTAPAVVQLAGPTVPTTHAGPITSPSTNVVRDNIEPS